MSSFLSSLFFRNEYEQSVPTVPANSASGWAGGKIEYRITLHSMQDIKARRPTANISRSIILLNIIVYIFTTVFIKFWYRVLSLKSALIIVIAFYSVLFNSHRYSEMELSFILIYTAA
jgi:hypothetical protein